MSKRVYRKRKVGEVDVERVAAELEGNEVVFAVDVAKEDMVGVLRSVGSQNGVTIGWRNLSESMLVLGLLERLRATGRRLVVVMESSGTYGDALRHLLRAAGFPIHRVSGKLTRDSAEHHDGTRSMHDAKAAAIIARLYVEGKTTLWIEPTVATRNLKAALTIMELHREQHLRLIHQLEAWTARHWPELTNILELTTATLLAVLGRIGGPREVTLKANETRALLHGIGHGLLQREKIEAVVESAGSTIGVPLEEVELRALQTLANEAHRALKEFKEAKRQVEVSAARSTFFRPGGEVATLSS